MSLLSGIRVVEFSQLIAGPLCALQLLDLGAEVIKVEPPDGELGRAMPPFAAETGESLWFQALNRGKLGVVVEPGDVVAVRALVATADVVVENLAGALGVAYGEVERPGQVWCAITGYGHGVSGRAIDPTLQASMGLMALTGEPDGPPARVPVSLIDLMTGMAATQAVLVALWRVERGGPGELVDVSLLDAAATLTGLQGVAALAGEPARRMGSQTPLVVPSAVYATADGFVQVVAVSDRHFRALCIAIERPGWAEDERMATAEARLAARDQIQHELAEVLATQPTAHWVRAIDEAGGLAEEVVDIEQAWAAPRLRERGLLGEVADGPLAGRPMPSMSPAVRHPATPSLARAPRIGEHTREVL